MAVKFSWGPNRPCGRPTKSKRPCKNTLGRFDQACPLHADEDDVETARLLEQLHVESRDSGYDSGYSSGRMDVEYALRQEKQAEINRQRAAQEEAMFRETDETGHYLVQVLVNGSVFTYRWRNAARPEVGTAVKVPPPWWDTGMKSPRDGEVVGIGSSYRGDLVTI